MKINTCFTPTEACTLIAHQAVSTLDAVQTEIPPCMKELRTAVEAMAAVHDLGKDGETLLDWLDTEIANAELYAAEGVNRPYLIDMEFLTVEPDAVAQMDLVWLLFETAAMEQCGPEQRQALLSTARTITEMCGLDDLLLATLRSNGAELAEGLSNELDEIRVGLQANAENCADRAQQEMR